MPYLSTYDHDVFVSYAHGPRSPLCRGEDDDLLGQWSRRLVKDLTNLVLVKLGTRDPARQVTFWMDPKLAGNDPLTDTLKDNVEKSALLLVIMSPYYLQSEWCGKEVEWFSATKPARGAKRRVFVARAWWTDPTSWPYRLRDADGIGYSFLPRDEEQADPFGYPCSNERDPAYWSALTKLGSDIARELKSFAVNEVPVAHTVARATPTTTDRVFLGYMSETLEDERAQLREQLTRAGFTVLPPPEEDPIDETSLRAALATQLRQTTSLVLVANEFPGLWPRGQNGGFIGYQLQKAKEFNVPCHMWLRVDDLSRIRRPDYRQYLETLSSQADSAGLVLRHDNLEQFVTYVRERTGQNPAQEAGVEELAVICSNLPVDRDVGQNFRDAILQAVKDTRREIFIFDFASSQDQVKLGKLSDRIRDADTVLVLCFNQEWNWARGLIREISGLRELRAGHRAKLLVAGPKDVGEGLYDAGAFGFKTVNGLHADADRVKQLLTQEILAAAAAQSAARPVL